MSEALVPAAAATSAVTDRGAVGFTLPQVIVDAGPDAVARFLEFFAGRIANERTRPRSVRKYTPRAQLKPLGAPEPASGAREIGGGGRPARLCQEETHVLAEQFGSTEHDAFRGPYLSENTPEAPFHGQAGRPWSRTCAARP